MANLPAAGLVQRSTKPPAAQCDELAQFTITIDTGQHAAWDHLPLSYAIKVDYVLADGSPASKKFVKYDVQPVNGVSRLFLRRSSRWYSPAPGSPSAAYAATWAAFQADMVKPPPSRVALISQDGIRFIVAKTAAWSSQNVVMALAANAPVGEEEEEEQGGGVEDVNIPNVDATCGPRHGTGEFAPTRHSSTGLTLASPNVG